MNKKRNRRDWSLLSSNIEALTKYHSDANTKLKDAARALCEKLKIEHISHAHINKSAKVWGAKPLMLCFCELTDQVLIEIFPAGSFVYQRFQDSGISFPLINHLNNKKSGKIIANLIQQIIIDLEESISFQKSKKSSNINHNERHKILQDTENLELLMRLLLAIDGELDQNVTLKWCEVCFRAANFRSNYCDLHNPKNDTEYRRGLKIKSLIPHQFQDQLISLHAKQKALGDDIILVYNTASLPDKITPYSQILYVDKDIIDLVNDSIHTAWCYVLHRWDTVLQTVPHTKSRLKFSANDYDSWEDFRNSVCVALENYYARVAHPYWFFQMLAEAELWFTFEDTLIQVKTDQKKDQILLMLSKGLRNRDIVNELQVSNSYVSELRKQYNKNRINN